LILLSQPGKKYNVQNTKENAGNNTGTEQENWEYGAVVQKGLFKKACSKGLALSFFKNKMFL
jgi:hypothetical protein